MWKNIIIKNESKKWVGSNEIILRKIGRITDVYISCLRINFGYDETVFKQEVLSTLDPYMIHAEGIRVLKEVIYPNIEASFINSNIDQKNDILLCLKNINSTIDYVLSLFYSNLKPETIQYILEIQILIEGTVNLGSFSHPL